MCRNLLQASYGGASSSVCCYDCKIATMEMSAKKKENSSGSDTLGQFGLLMCSGSSRSGGVIPKLNDETAKKKKVDEEADGQKKKNPSTPVIDVDPFAPRVTLKRCPMEVLGEQLRIVGSLVISKTDEKAKYEDIIKMVRDVPTADYGLKVANVLSNDTEEILLQLSGQKERFTEFVDKVQQTVADLAKVYLYNPGDEGEEDEANDAVDGDEEGSITSADIAPDVRQKATKRKKRWYSSSPGLAKETALKRLVIPSNLPGGLLKAENCRLKERVAELEEERETQCGIME